MSQRFRLMGFQSGLLTNATWGMGLTATAAGWLVTSKEARQFLAEYKPTCRVFSVLIVAGTVGYIILLCEIWSDTAAIGRQLSALEVPQYLYAHHLVTRLFATSYAAFQAAATFGLVVLLEHVARMGGDMDDER